MNQTIGTGEMNARRSRAREAYIEALEAVRGQETMVQPLEALAGPVGRACDALLAVLGSEADALLVLAARSTAGNPLHAHAVNVAILALQTSRGLRVEPRPLRLLGASALLHDGLRLGSRPDGRRETETRLHPVSPEALFKHAAELERVLPRELSSVYQSHPGWTEGEWLEKRRPVHQGAHIVALCDIYETISHPRPWRDPALPHETLMTLLKQHRRESDQRLLKVFTESLSLYPPGSFVQLSSGEIGMVAAVCPDSPTRPRVEVRLRADGQAQRPPLSVELARQPHVSIVRAVDETRLPVRDRRLALQLRAARWWA